MSPDCERCREALPAVLLGVASPGELEAVREHAAACSDCAREARALQAALAGLGAAEARPAPPELRARVLAAAAAAAAARPARARVLAFVALGLVALAAAVGALVARPDPGPRGAFVVAAAPGGRVVVGNAGRGGPVVEVVGPDGSRRTVRVGLDLERPAWFTEAVVGQDGLAYLLDAANGRMLVVDPVGATLVSSRRVGGDPAGVALGRGWVSVKGASSAVLTTFKPAMAVETRLAPDAGAMPLADAMDAALVVGGRLYVTHHVTSEVSVLDADSQQLIARARVGRAPVGLALLGGQLFVLDVAGALHVVDPDTLEVRASLSLDGTPDKLAVSGGRLYLSDRAGMVTAVDPGRLAVVGRRRIQGGTPMDLTTLADGRLAVAIGRGGVLILGRDLEVLGSL